MAIYTHSPWFPISHVQLTDARRTCCSAHVFDTAMEADSSGGGVVLQFLFHLLRFSSNILVCLFLSFLVTILTSVLCFSSSSLCLCLSLSVIFLFGFRLWNRWCKENYYIDKDKSPKQWLKTLLLLLLLLLCSSPVLHLQRFSSRILVCCFFLVLITILLVLSLFSPSSLCLSV